MESPVCAFLRDADTVTTGNQAALPLASRTAF
jgi:hypothetical protein